MNLNQHRKLERSEENKAAWAIRSAPLALRQAIVEENEPAAREALKHAILGDKMPCRHCMQHLPQPWAIRAWMEAAGAVGTMGQVIVNLNASLGVRDETELAELVSAGREVQQLREDIGQSLERVRDDAVEVLQKVVFKAHPEWREQVVAQLGSVATVIESTNGEDH